VDWILPRRAPTVVDLGAGTGALARLLMERADEVVAVEPDDRMRAVLEESVHGAHVVKGTGESMPLPDGTVDAVLASSSWHWVDPQRALPEVARVLVPGGILGAIWSGPDPEGAFLSQAQALLADRSRSASTSGDAGEPGRPDFAGMVMRDAQRPASALEIPGGSPFAPPEQEVFQWDMALTADDLIGMLGTFSWILMMDDATRTGVLAEARRLLKELLGVEGDVTVDIAFRADTWRTRLTS
jgi:SAM-dependent methyltransferase